MSNPVPGPAGPPRKSMVSELVAFLGRPRMLDTLWFVGPGSDGPARFGELMRASGVPRNTLATRLKELVDAGFLHRIDYEESPPKVEYEVTQQLLDLIPVFQGLHNWCDKWELKGEE